MDRPAFIENIYRNERVQRVLSFLQVRRRSYQLAFGNPAGERVLADLARFCRASQTCFSTDPRLHAVLEGRREVWLRIQNHLNLPAERLLSLYDAGAMPPTEDDR